jgi:arginyl-tRNA--protein-N-Asp/Glu arginylyltransferase
MIASRVEPDTLSRAALDEYLSRGWYRIGRALITTDYLVSDGELRSTIWTRLDLQSHEFRGSLRKQLARVHRDFQITIGDLVLDATHEALYTRYREMAGGSRAESLDEVTGGEEGRSLFHTLEIGIYRDGVLVAFSWFDLGETSVESLIGVYDPAYRKHGLGFCTLLLEIAHAAEIGIRYHYSGYVLSEPSGMDYKRRVGRLEYFDPASKVWLEDTPYAPGQSPAEIQRRRLAAAAQALTSSGSPVTHVLNSALLIPGLRDHVPGCTLDPILLISAASQRSQGVLTTWDQARERYVLFRGQPISVLLGRSDDEDAAPPVQVHLFVVRELLTEHETADEVAFWVRHYLGMIEAHSGE